MSDPTDKTIEIRCGECDADGKEYFDTGVATMIDHIIKSHPKYNAHEADVFASAWREDAYDLWDEANQAYTKDVAYERKLNALRGKP